MKQEELLLKEDWEKLKGDLTAFALKHTGRGSLARAEDLAQSAIVALLQRPDGWNPEEPLLKHLAKRVIGIARNEWQRKRHALETLLLEKGDELPEVDDGREATEDVLDRRRLAAQFRARLEARFPGDEIALAILPWMAEGHETPTELAEVTRLPIEQICEARRRIFYHAKLVTKEMSAEIVDAEGARSDEEKDQ